MFKGFFNKQTLKSMIGAKFFIQLFRQVPWRYYIKRHVSEKVRVRFAPSPTGYLHLGGLRTALYNHLFAKAQNGVTIIRIEDTDLTRIVPGAAETLLEDLEWCGIKYDEGPFYQSDRTEIYQRYAKQLIEQGDAYYCFCSNIRMDLIRREAIKAGEVPKYDNRCRHLSKEAVKKNLTDGVPWCIRFKLSSYKEPYNDLVYGPVKCNIAEVEGDPVILKGDGLPTYHLSNVIDDHLMNISHVLRGNEWMTSTTKHLLLYKAFKWDPPLYAHLPLLFNPDGTKLSKRQGDTYIRTLRDSGYLPNSLINFVIRFGGGFELDNLNKSYTFEELISRFKISKLKESSCKISLDVLKECNNLEIKKLIETKEGTNYLVLKSREIIEKHFEGSGKKVNINDEHLKLVLTAFQNRIQVLEDLVSENFFFLWIQDNKWEADNDIFAIEIKNLCKEIEMIKWNLDDLKKCLKMFCKNKKFKVSDFMKTLRLILMGKPEGPAVAEIMEVLGRKEVLLRLSNAIKPQ